jgi:uncharacterized membrane protein
VILEDILLINMYPPSLTTKVIFINRMSSSITAYIGTLVVREGGYIFINRMSSSITAYIGTLVVREGGYIFINRMSSSITAYIKYQCKQ